MGGAGGQQVLESVCAACWEEWRETSAQLINHYGLGLGKPAHPQQLRGGMRGVLELEKGRPPPGPEHVADGLDRGDVLNRVLVDDAHAEGAVALVVGRQRLVDVAG